MNDLLHACHAFVEGDRSTPGNAFWAGICYGYFRAYMDAALVAQQVDGVMPLFCGRREASVGEILAAFAEWVNGNPDHRTYEPAIAGYMALRDRYPCP